MLLAYAVPDKSTSYKLLDCPWLSMPDGHATFWQRHLISVLMYTPVIHVGMTSVTEKPTMESVSFTWMLVHNKPAWNLQHT